MATFYRVTIFFSSFKASEICSRIKIEISLFSYSPSTPNGLYVNMAKHNQNDPAITPGFSTSRIQRQFPRINRPNTSLARKTQKAYG